MVIEDLASPRGLRDFSAEKGSAKFTSQVSGERYPVENLKARDAKSGKGEEQKDSKFLEGDFKEKGEGSKSPAVK